jgi:hypothetical protein
LSIASQIEADFQQMNFRVEAKRTVNINYDASTRTPHKPQQGKPTENQKFHNKTKKQPPFPFKCCKDYG